MSIATAITNAQDKVAAAYTALNAKGATMPATQDLANMPTAIASIPSGGNEDALLLAIKGMTATDVTLPSGLSARYALNSLFYNNNVIQSVTIPTDITIMGSYAFTNATSLKRINSDVDGTINIWQGVTMIDVHCFNGASSIKVVNIPSSVATIGAYVFRSCTSLETINIPDDVTTIQTQLFYGCNALVVIDFGNTRASVPTLANTNAFHTTNATTLSNRKIIVPDSLYNDWVAASNWSSTTYSIVNQIIKYSDYYTS